MGEQAEYEISHGDGHRTLDQQAEEDAAAEEIHGRDWWGRDTGEATP